MDLESADDTINRYAWCIYRRCGCSRSGWLDVRSEGNCFLDLIGPLRSFTLVDWFCCCVSHIDVLRLSREECREWLWKLEKV